jgi:hypothetical protein
MKPYTADPTPGDFDHRSSDCDVHGTNIPVARAKGSLGRYECVACLLDVAEILKRQEEKAK